MPDEESFECEKCGRTFDSQRGLSIHQTQSHTDEENNEADQEEIEDSTEKEEDEKLSLTVKQGLIGVFIIGVLTGFTAGIITPLNPIEPTGQSNTDSASPQVVSLQSSEYPFKGINAGVGSEDLSEGNTTINLEGEPYLGSPSAEATIVAYEDFECPFCNRYNNRAFPKIVDNYVSNGKARYYLKNFPLSRIHPWAEKGGIAAECALNQDVKAFWSFKHGFFNNQDSLNAAYKANTDLFDQSMKKWSKQLDLDTEKFNSCYDNQQTIQEVRQDQREGVEDGVEGTPTVFVEDTKLVGAQPFSRFKTAIDQALSE